MGLVNRHLLPKVAFTLLLLTSLAGTAMTMGTHGAPAGWTILRWMHLVAAALVAGGSLWWAAFVRDEAEAGDAQGVEPFAQREVERYQSLLCGSGIVMLGTALHLLFFTGKGVREFVILHGALVLAVGGLVGSTVLCPRHRATRWADPRRWLLLAGGVGVLSTAAATDAFLQARGAAWPLVVRTAHVVAFGLWLGGAAWNLWVAIPAAQQDPRVPVVLAAARQLERFRWTVRVVLPTLLLTGVLQAVPYAAGSFGGLVATWPGRLILLKAGALMGLVGIFVACPLWRACSPVRGMCDVRDLHRSEPAPSRTLDNRGKPCAGFVHIHRALEALRPGEVLELLSTDPVSWWELPAWARQNGYEVVDQRPWGRYRVLWRTYRFLIRRPALEAATAGPA
ncbi:MAG: sulfurtransferase TusA family protein [bacterium]